MGRSGGTIVARTKKQKEPVPQPAVVNGPTTGEVLTLAEAAALLRVSEQGVVAAVTGQGLPARMIDGQWRFTQSAILRWLSVTQPPPEKLNAAMLAMAGAWKDDPYLEDMV